MKLLKKSFKLLIVAVLVAAFALTVTACKKDDKNVTTYKVSYVTNMSGVEVPPEYVEEGNAATRPATPTCDGFTFIDWYASSSADGEPYDFTAPVTQNLKLYGKWVSGSTPVTPPEGDDPVNPQPGAKVTVTLNMLYDGKTTPVEIKSGETLPSEYSELTREDFTFGGWFTDEACTQLYNLKTPVTKNMTLYAKWSKKGTDGDGINFSKYWDGASGGTSGGVDGFTFTKTVNIGSVSVDPGETAPTVSEGEQCIVTFNSKSGSAVSAQAITSGGTAVKPETPEYDGYMFCGWYTDAECSNGNLYDFTSKVDKNITLYAKWVQVDSKIQSVKGYEESLAVVWADSNPSSASVQYKAKESSTWKSVDAPLIRDIGGGETRVDIVGLTKGDYNVKINTSSGSSIELPETVHVDAYDRSGYAHFERKTTEAAQSGVGAYKDNGELKDNALVIYVTDKNKDNVMKEVCDANSDVPMFKIPGSDWGNKDANGIGWWLNNNQYTASNAGSKNNKEPSNTYDSANGGKLSFKAVNRPIVIRFIGTVTTPEGCTAYDSTKEGGGIGDNGHMARMKNLKNVTLEGIGDDAMIKGWGFHYVIGTDARDGQGTSFEVRNLTFSEYPEDAIGMEGQQEGGKITAGVERCWIHNNVFLPGRCDNPAQSDKAEGDGSCDFKRGQYYTLSYNYFEYCHKTNLIGSSDSSLQYNITMHHNMWYQCGSRIPLLRQANVHFYNNYIFGDPTEKSTPYSHISKPDLSYVSSFRANCLMFSEANYFDGCKNVTQKKNGLGVAWNNTYYACSDENLYTELSSRTQSVSSNCAYNGVNYTGFYANDKLFYYDSVNKVSDCLLDDSVGARLRVLQHVGVKDFGKTNLKMNKYEPTEAVKAGTTVNTSSLKGSSEVNGVQYNLSGGKGKGQIITFKTTAEIQVTINVNSGTGTNPALVDSYGKVWANNMTGTVIVVIPAGTYFIGTGIKDKESTIDSISFADTAASAEARIQTAKSALTAIPEEIGYNHYEVIKTALDAYSALLSTEREQIDSNLYARLQKAEKAFNDLRIEYVIARIDYIGTVTKDSYNKINAAWAEYSKLSAEQQTKITNYSALEKAQDTFEQFAVQNVIDRILDLPDLSKATILTHETLDKVEKWYHAVDLAFEALSTDEDKEGESQQSQVKAHNGGKTYAILTNGLAEMHKFENMINFKAALEEISVDEVTIGDGASLKGLHDSLSEEQLGTLSLAEKTKYDEVIAKYTELANKSAASTFIGGKPSNEVFKVNSGNASNTKFVVNAYGGELESGLKMESSTQVEFTISAKMVLKLYLDESGKIKVGKDGSPKNKVDPEYASETEGGDNVVTVTLEAGTYYITKSSSLKLYYATLTPAE